MHKSLNIIFCGTPDFAADTLTALLNSHHQVVGVYTQPDRRSGRGKKLTASPVKNVALENGLPVYQPFNFKESTDLQQLNDIKADIMVVVAYGLLLPLSVLNTPPLGCINVHASLLPRWRGAAPIERALLSGDKETGVTIMQMDEGLDTGDMLLKRSITISDTMTSQQLHDQLIPIGSSALLQTLDKIAAGTQDKEIQDNALACYAEKLYKAEGLINWQQSATQISRQIRGFNPRPVAFSTLDSQTIRIWAAVTRESDPAIALEKPTMGTIVAINKDNIEVACLDSTILVITKAQLPGGKQLSVRDLLNSGKNLFAIGKKFISPTNNENIT